MPNATEPASDTDLDLAVDQLVGPIYYRVLVTGHTASPTFTDALADAVLTRLVTD